MFNFHHLSVPLNSWISKATKKQGEAIQKRIDTLQAKRDSLNTEKKHYEGIVMAKNIREAMDSNYRELLLEEIEIRNDLAAWYELEHKDKLVSKNKATAEYEAKQQFIFDKMKELGFTGGRANQLANNHPELIELRTIAESHPDTSYAVSNNEDILQIKAELQGIKIISV